MTKSNSHFTNLMITKDTSGNADFIFGINMDRMMLDNSAYSALIENMTDIAKRQVASNNEILSFNINRRQIKKELSLNSLGSPMMPEVFSNETISHQVLGSIGEMKEVPITVSGGSSGIKYLTASDLGLAEQTAGTYQYSLSISTIDGFVPTINKLLEKLYKSGNDISSYLAMLDISDNYNSEKRKVKIPVTKAHAGEMSKAYVDAISYFQNLKNIDTEYKRASSLLASSSASKESIELFQKRLNSVISRAEALISKTGTGASPASVANQSANSGLTNPPTVEINHSFSDTVSVENTDNKYVDFFKGKGKIGGGLNTYSNTEVKKSKPETIYLEASLTSLELLESKGVTFAISPVSVTAVGDASVQDVINTDKYIGSSAIAVGGLLKDDLSPMDLSTVTVGSLVSTTDISAALMPLTSKIDESIPQTMVLVASQTSDTAAPTTDSLAPMLTSLQSISPIQETLLKSLEWMPIEEVNVAKGTTVLCKQEGGLADVANGFFLMEIK